MKEIPLDNGQNAKAFAIDYFLLIIDYFSTIRETVQS